MQHYEYKVNPSVNTLTGASHSHKQYSDVKDNAQQLENFLNALDKEGWQVFSFGPHFVVRRPKEN